VIEEEVESQPESGSDIITGNFSKLAATTVLG